MRKIINSATTQYEPVLTEELVLDDRPISGSFNSITSDAVYKAISVDPGNVPPVESTDDGKVLTASYSEGTGSFEWATPSGGSDIPEYTTSDDGKVLGVVVDSSGESPVASLDWVDQPANELPAQLGTAGQVLTVNSGATGVEWATPSGGGGGSVSMSPLLQANRLTINDGVGHGTIQTWVTPSGSSFSGTLSKNDVLFLDLYITCESAYMLTSSDTFSATVYCDTVDPILGDTSYVPMATIAASTFFKGGSSAYGVVRVPLYLDRNMSVSSDSTTRDWTLKVDLTVPDTTAFSCNATIKKL